MEGAQGGSHICLIFGGLVRRWGSPPSSVGGPQFCPGQPQLHAQGSLPPAGEGPRAHLRKLAECIRWSYGAGIVLRLGNIARLELNYCIPMGVQQGDK